MLLVGVASCGHVDLLPDRYPRVFDAIFVVRGGHVSLPGAGFKTDKGVTCGLWLVDPVEHGSRFPLSVCASMSHGIGIGIYWYWYLFA